MHTPLVLIADDDPALRQALPDTLQRHLPGILVETCPSAEAAVSYLEASEYDVVITDVRMPGDGLALLRTVRRRWPHTPVVVITGYGDNILLRAAREEGAFAFFDKPIERDQFTAMIAKAIQVHGLEHQREELERELSLLRGTGDATPTRIVPDEQEHLIFLVRAREDLKRRLEDTDAKLHDMKRDTATPPTPPDCGSH